MKPIFHRRDFLAELLALPVDYKVTRYSQSVFGGPLTAEISVTGNENDLWEMMERLRCPVEIYSDKGDALWWGYVAAIDLTIGNVQAGVTIDSMANRIAVAYNATDPTNENVGARMTTAWVEDALSTVVYGTRELLLTSSGSTAEHAESARDMALASMRFPQPTITFSETPGEPGATLYCRGWYSTLDWTYYSTAAADVDTATQAKNIAVAKGPFFAGVKQDVTSGILTSAFRDGDGKSMYVIQELLKMGTSNTRRMLASVDLNRYLTIYEEPLPSNPFLITRDGKLRDAFDNPVRAETCPVGVWMRLKDVIPSSVDTTLLADPTLAFVDMSEFEVESKKLRLTPRNLENPWDIGVPSDG